MAEIYQTNSHQASASGTGFDRDPNKG